MLCLRCVRWHFAAATAAGWIARVTPAECVIYVFDINHIDGGGGGHGVP